MVKFVWYSDDLLNALNSLGFVHFKTKEQAAGFHNGSAFYFDEEKKEYGYCGHISCTYKDCAKNREDIIGRSNLLSA